jgi:protease-4
MKKTVLALLILFTIAGGSGQLFSQKDKAAVIDLSGTITPSQTTGLTVSSGFTPSEVRELNQKAKDRGADAIIYEINSGGGAVVASKEVYRSIEDVKIPTVCRMRDVAASGGYMIALGCDRIVADSSTLTGSIGVKSSYIQYAGVLDKLGAEYVNISAGNRKEIGNPFMNASEEEEEVLQEKVDTIQQDFLKMTREERNLTESEMREVRTGEPFLGSEAQNLSLVDRLGGRETAQNEVENLTGEEIETFKVETTSDINFLSLLTADMSISNLLDFSAPFRAKWG